MYRSLVAASLSVLALSATASSQDEPQFTLGAGYERYDFDGVDLDSFVLRGGYDFNQYWGVEGQLNLGLGDDSVAVGGSTGTVELNYGAGLFGVVRPWSNESANVFLRAGYTVTDAEASLAGISVSDDDNAWAFGAGGEWFFSGNNGVRVDYTRYEFDEGSDADVFGIAYVRRFGG
ncbi:porin family protein [Maricaulis parjimensis]|uniref:porin family protein n=1 Tax=Maricaulis parjimensis TaxID=144023 RepID=UPI00193A71DD|nr:porin family protein [Maricaulis parjimensis]